MLEVFNRNRSKIAILKNAYNLIEEEKINSISHFTFTLPYDDPKNTYCEVFNYICYNGGQYYRIMPSELKRDNIGGITYTCEHVIAVLIDKAMLGYNIVGNIGTYTADCIRYVLNKQSSMAWTLSRCDYTRQFQYGWENESLLSALWSIATPLSDPYMWDFDTSVYPWRLSLLSLNMSVLSPLYIRAAKNMLDLNVKRSAETICTRIYPFGYGEGVNQLTIKSVNGGVNYLQAPASEINKYGIIERVWIDRRYENADSLKQAAQAMLNEMMNPQLEISVGLAELNTEEKITLGRRVRIVDGGDTDIITYVVGITRNYSDITDTRITLANKPADIAGSIADMADRQRIEMSYAQGATQLYAQSLQANCNASNGAKINFYIPEEMRIINKVIAKIRLEPFRAYSQATTTEEQKIQTTSTEQQQQPTTSSGGSSTNTSSSGGGSTQTSSSGGGSSTSSGASGQATPTSSSGGGASPTSAVEVWMLNARNGHNHGIPDGYWLRVASDANPATDDTNASIAWTPSGQHTHTINVPDHTHTVTVPSHTHTVSITAHTHTVSVPAHTHTVNVPAHTHTVSIKAHSHNVTVPAHNHNITPGIYTFGNPTTMQIYVNGQYKTIFNGRDAEIDLTAYLISNGKIPRGTWHSVEIRPNDLAYVNIDMFLQGFVQSRGDETV
jgi:phage minor structural protein